MACKTNECRNIPKLRPNGVYYVRCTSCTFHHQCVVCGDWCPKRGKLYTFCYNCWNNELIKEQYYDLHISLEMITRSWHSGWHYLLEATAKPDGWNDRFTLFIGRKMWEKRHPKQYHKFYFHYDNGEVIPGTR